MQRPGPGFFVALEGPEGSGKSTQAGLLAARLRAEGWAVLLTREPGGTPLGERIRDLVLTESDYAILPEAEALLYAAARAQHVREVILPVLARGDVVVCDRFADSTLAYQGGGRGLPLVDLLAVQRVATGGLEPDLRVLLDIPVEVGLGRRFGTPGTINRLDAEDIAFHARVRAAYLALAAEQPAGWVTLDATGPADDVARVIAAEVMARIVRGCPVGRPGPVAGTAGTSGGRP